VQGLLATTATSWRGADAGSVPRAPGAADAAILLAEAAMGLALPSRQKRAFIITPRFCKGGRPRSDLALIFDLSGRFARPPLDEGMT